MFSVSRVLFTLIVATFHVAAQSLIVDLPNRELRLPSDGGQCNVNRNNPDDPYPGTIPLRSSFGAVAYMVASDPKHRGCSLSRRVQARHSHRHNNSDPRIAAAITVRETEGLHRGQPGQHSSADPDHGHRRLRSYADNLFQGRANAASGQVRSGTDILPGAALHKPEPPGAPTRRRGSVSASAATPEEPQCSG